MVGEIFIYWSKSHVSPCPLHPPFHPQEASAQRHPPPTLSDPHHCLPHQNFKREEQNFVVQNEINNMSFLTADNKSKMAKVGVLFRKVGLAGRAGTSPRASYPPPPHPASCLSRSHSLQPSSPLSHFLLIPVISHPITPYPPLLSPYTS